VHERFSPKNTAFATQLRPHLAEFDKYTDTMSNYYVLKDAGRTDVAKPATPKTIIDLFGKGMDD
jgi:hypothetical protein